MQQCCVGECKNAKVNFTYFYFYFNAIFLKFKVFSWRRASFSFCLFLVSIVMCKRLMMRSRSKADLWISLESICVYNTGPVRRKFRSHESIDSKHR